MQFAFDMVSEGKLVKTDLLKYSGISLLSYLSFVTSVTLSIQKSFNTYYHCVSKPTHFFPYIFVIIINNNFENVKISLKYMKSSKNSTFKQNCHIILKKWCKTWHQFILMLVNTLNISMKILSSFAVLFRLILVVFNSDFNLTVFSIFFVRFSFLFS